MSTVHESVSVSFAGLNARGTIPTWAKTSVIESYLPSGLRLHNFERCTASELIESKSLPELIVLNATSPKKLSDFPLIINGLSHLLKNRSQVTWLIISYPTAHDTPKRIGECTFETLKYFPYSTEHIEISLGKEQLQHTFYEAFAKWFASTKIKKISESQTDPLSEAREVIKATRPLLASSGRLSAKSIAKEFGLSLTKLSESIGRLKQTVSKTPDSPKIQSDLKPFEKTFRLRAMLSDRDFKAWLKRPNRHLDEATPLELILNGDTEIVADFAEDMLTGAPS